MIQNQLLDLATLMSNTLQFKNGKIMEKLKQMQHTPGIINLADDETKALS